MIKRIRRSGFTLPEVLVTVTVVAVLAAVVVPAVTGYVTRGNAPAVVQDIDAIRGSLTAYVSDTRQYPANFYDLTTDPDVDGWKGPYLQSVILSGATAAGKFTNEGFNLELGPNFTAESGYLTTTFAFESGKCSDLWALDEAVDNSTIDSDAAITDAKSAGSVQWTHAACNTYATAGSTAITAVTDGKIRLIATGS